MKKAVLVTVLILFVMGLVVPVAAAGSEARVAAGQAQVINIEVNGKLIESDVPPRIVSGRTILPLRFIGEALGSKVEWCGTTRAVVIADQDKPLLNPLSGPGTEITIVINGKVLHPDVPPQIIDGRTMVPVRVVSEALGAYVAWDGTSRTVSVQKETGKEEKPGTGTPSDLDEQKAEAAAESEKPELHAEHTADVFNFKGIAIGDTTTEVEQLLGRAARQDLSKYGFYWKVYNQDYSDYLQVGMENGRVVALYSNSGNWRTQYGFTTATSKSQVQQVLGSPLASIRKGNINFIIRDAKSDTYLIDGIYATFMYDLLDGERLDAILLVEQAVEEGMAAFYAPYSAARQVSFERQVFDLTNVLRVKQGLKPFSWNDKVAAVAREHSKDKARQGYFSHTGLDGRSPFDRMEDGGITYTAASENIAMGQTNSIEAYHGWLNSAGHRRNMLGDYEMLGVGVAFADTEEPYYTQKLYSGPGEKKPRP